MCCLEMKKMQDDLGPKMPLLDRKLLRSKSCISKHAINLKPRRSFTPTSPKSAANFPPSFYETKGLPLIESKLMSIKLLDRKDFSYHTPTSKSSSYAHVYRPASSSPSIIKLPDFSKNIDDFDVRPILLIPRAKRCISTQAIVPNIVPMTPTSDDAQIYVSNEYAYSTPKTSMF